jgi:hypothetical protein
LPGVRAGADCGGSGDVTEMFCDILNCPNPGAIQFVDDDGAEWVVCAEDWEEFYQPKYGAASG